MGWLCNFRPCRWIWKFNAMTPHLHFGVYQCSTCKTISLGAERDVGTAR